MGRLELMIAPDDGEVPTYGDTRYCAKEILARL